MGWMVESIASADYPCPETIPTFGLPELRACPRHHRQIRPVSADRPLVPDFDDLDLPAVQTICRDVLATRRAAG
ncbi:MAG: hypothetical protein MRJ92_01525 [Nitrospira sp.]|nr:hypothetical protein [Nitrospira sp.]